MAYTNTLEAGQRARRKLIITVAEWTTGSGSSAESHRTILGKRTEDSSIELNADIETTTDVLGITYTDVNKTEPQQDFDPHYIIGGEAIDEYLLNAVLTNDIDKYNNVFTLYIIVAFLDDTSGSSHAYKCIKHTGCTILATNIGGDSYTKMNLEVHFSNNITQGSVDKLTDDFVFTAD